MLKPTHIFVLLVVLCLTALMTGTAQAADITVDLNCSLADAITAANRDTASGGCLAGNGADTISLTGNITLDASLPSIASDITISGNDYTISGNEEHQIFWVEESGALTIHNATLADGRGEDDDDLFDEDIFIGGAVVNWGRLEVRDSILRGNSADRGGAIGNWGEAISIINCTVHNNSGPYGGAALYSGVDANIRIISSNFSDNERGALNSIGATTIEVRDSTFTGHSWSVISVDGAETLSIVDSVFTNNQSQYGTVRGDSATVQIRRSEFSGNSATADGGAINIIDHSNDDVRMNIVDSRFLNNSSIYNNGGALFVSGEVYIKNSEFVGNSAEYRDSYGGAVASLGQLSISDSRFEDNTAAQHGGAIATKYEAAEIKRSTFQGNSSSQSGGAISTGSAETVIMSSSFFGNSALEDGGAVFVRNHSSVRISDSRFRANSAGDEGGAVRGKEQSIITVDQSTFDDNTAEDGGAIYSWGETNVSQSTFTNNSAIEEGGAIANHGIASINSSILADNPGGDCHIGREGELLESGNNHIVDGSCGAKWSGPVTEGYCPPGQDLDGICQIGGPMQS